MTLYRRFETPGARALLSGHELQNRVGQTGQLLVAVIQSLAGILNAIEPPRQLGFDQDAQRKLTCRSRRSVRAEAVEIEDDETPPVGFDQPQCP
jgi:hypothetical protein